MSARAGSGQLRRGSGSANRPGLGLPAAAQNEQTVYHIMYDILYSYYSITFKTNHNLCLFYALNFLSFYLRIYYNCKIIIVKNNYSFYLRIYYNCIFF